MHLADTIFVLCLFNPSIDCTLLSHILKYNYLLNIHNNPPPWKKIWHETKILLLRSTFMKSFMICMCSIWKLRKRCRFTVWPGDIRQPESVFRTDWIPHEKQACLISLQGFSLKMLNGQVFTVNILAHIVKGTQVHFCVGSLCVEL